MSEEYKKFGELTRKEQLELVNHVLDGGHVEILMEDQDKWYNVQDVNKTTISFHLSYPYRKVKTELEILKEDYEKIGKKIKELEAKPSDIEVGDSVLRNADGRAFIVGESGLRNFPFLVEDVCYTSKSLAEDFTLLSRMTINH